MEVKEISRQEYQEFIKNLLYFPLQSEKMVDRLEELGRHPVIFGGFVDGKLVIAEAFGIYRHNRLYRYLYSNYGYVSLDPASLEWVTAFMKGVEAHYKNSNVIAVRFETMVELGSINRKMEMDYADYDNRDYRQGLLDAGFIGRDLHYDSVTHGQPRQVAIVDTAVLENFHGYQGPETKFVRMKTMDELLAAMDIKTRRLVKLSLYPYIKVEETDTDTLYRIGLKSGEYQDFYFPPTDILNGIKKAFREDCRIKLCYLDAAEYKAYSEQKIREIEEEIAALRAKNTKKSLVKARDLEDTLHKNQKNLQEAQGYLDAGLEKVELAASMFLYTPKMVTYMWSGMDRSHGDHNGTLRLLYDTLEEAVRRGAWQFNLLGVAGHYDRTDTKNFGLVQFKTGFGARLAEFCGVVYWPVHSLFNRSGKLTARMPYEIGE